MYPKIQFQNESLIKKEGLSNIDYPNLFSNHFCWSVVGNPGSGKTTFIQNILKQNDMYKGKFDYIFIISPSNIQIEGVDSECYTNELKIDWIYERINYLNSKRVQGQNLLIIMDDCISQIKKIQNDQMLIDLFFNRRHLWKGNTISLLITTQQFTMVPLRFRCVSDHFTFLSMSPRDFDFVKKELIYSTSRKCMDQILQTFQDQTHQFIYIRLQPFLLCQNFKPLIQGSQYVSLSNEFQPVQSQSAKQGQQKSTEPKQQQQNSHQQNNQNSLFSFRKFN